MLIFTTAQGDPSASSPPPAGLLYGADETTGVGKQQLLPCPPVPGAAKLPSAAATYCRSSTAAPFYWPTGTATAALCPGFSGTCTCCSAARFAALCYSTGIQRLLSVQATTTSKAAAPVAPLSRRKSITDSIRDWPSFCGPHSSPPAMSLLLVLPIPSVGGHENLPVIKEPSQGDIDMFVGPIPAMATLLAAPPLHPPPYSPSTQFPRQSLPPPILHIPPHSLCPPSSSCPLKPPTPTNPT